MRELYRGQRKERLGRDWGGERPCGGGGQGARKDSWPSRRERSGGEAKQRTHKRATDRRSFQDSFCFDWLRNNRLLIRYYRHY